MKTLKELYMEHQGKVSDKWSLYLNEYERLLSPYRKMKINLLEIGVQNGGSLEIWGKYFPHAKKIIGCDINPDCKKLSYEDSRITVVVGDANSNELENEILNLAPEFDIIIDDGSHFSGDIIRTFSIYFEKLVFGGIYIAEDLHCSYWKEFEGGVCYPYSSLSFFKKIADAVNHEHWGVDRDKTHFLKGFSDKYGITFDNSSLSTVHSVELINSICVIRKDSENKNVLGERFVSGLTEGVVPGFLSGEFTKLYFDQHSNDWASFDISPEEQYLQLKDKLAERDAQLAERDAHLESLLASRSWRITAPLRAAGESYRKIRSDLKQIHTLIKTYGVIRLGQKSFETIRKGGLRALGSRLKSCGITDSRTDYTEWIRRYDTLDDPARGIIRDRIAEMDNPPRISIVMPVYNPEPRFLAEAVKSVQNQLYPHWELCIADDASTDENIRPLLERYALEDDRIRVVFRKENGHISEASNSALALATGEFVALLDNDDILSEVALFCVAKEILKKPEIALIYSDEDKIDTKNRRFAPYFKSDFNYDLFLSQNMVSHLGVYRRDLVETVGAFRTEMVGAQDYDLALRIIDIIDYSQIFHIPKVLYHWRVHPESTAQTADAKPYAMIAGERAINEHLKRNKINASAELLGWGYRVKYELPENIPLVSIVIPTKNNYLVLKKCIESILGNTSYSNYEVIIVDNGSNECKTLEYLSVLQKKVRFSVIRDESEFNYSYLNNKAVKISLGEVICLLNDDIEIIDAGWLTELVSIAMQPNVGVVGARLWYPDNSIQHAGVILGLGVHRVAGHAHYRAPKGNYGYFGRAALMQSFSAVTGACMVVRKSIYEMVGGLDEDLAVAFNDVDFCLRVGNKGYRVVWTPYAEMIHHESVSRGVEDSPEKVARFKREIQKMQLHWGDTLLNDPAYSPNLTLDHEDFSLAWPPRKN